MLHFVALGAGALLLTYAIHSYRCFSRNLAAAKASSIPYVITPIYLLNTFWLITHRFWLIYLKKLPKSWTYPWLDVLDVQWTYVTQYGIFKDLGSDTILTVSPAKNMLWTADANVINQITTRRNDFPKPIDMYDSLDMYGKNVVTTEGAMWRKHRKITGPQFTEKNNHMVWQESLHLAQAMLNGWVGPNGEGVGVRSIHTLPADAMRLSLYVISRAGFGIRLHWPGEEVDDSEIKGTISAKALSEGHTMNYTDAMRTLLHSVLWLLLVPKFLLRNLPIKAANRAIESYTEWGRYMDQLFQAKKADIAAGKNDEESGLDLMAALAKAAGASDPSLEKEKQPLTDSEVMGNSFIFTLAGHETTANTIHFIVLYLAMNPSTQRALQADLDNIFQGRKPSEWDYETDFKKVFAGMAGAVMAEQLRILPPVMNIPKHTPLNSPQPLNMNGQKVTVPGGTLINLSCSAAHRNPKYWPAGPPSDPFAPIHPISNTDNDLEEFKPERWFLKDSKSDSSQKADAHSNGHANGNANSHASHVDRKLAAVVIQENSETDSLAINTAADTANTLFHPPPGAYIPFSEGYRACIGRRFAQVEVLAVLALIFTQYSVELTVDKLAGDEEVKKMDPAEKKEVWGKERRRVMGLLRDDLISVLTLQLRNDVVPLRIVKRGSERFNF